jgi:hypothetical protein
VVISHFQDKKFIKKVTVDHKANLFSPLPWPDR